MSTANAKKGQPCVGYMDIGDPRHPPETVEAIVSRGREIAAALRAKDVKVIEAEQLVATEPVARAAVERLKAAGAEGIVIRCAWFLRANVIAGIAQYAYPTPVILWAVENPNDVGYEGLALSHGALDEIGMPHQYHYGDLGDDGLAPVVAWAKACHIKASLLGAIYGEIGGRSLEMMPASSDDNQLRKIFGLHVDPLEQWTLIRRAETVPESAWKPIVERVRAECKVVDASPETLEKSAKLYVAGSEIIRERGWSFAGIQCQMEMIDNYLGPCLPVALWNEEGFVVSCETDVNNALSMYVGHKITGQATMFCDIFYMDPRARVIHALNCGTGAPSLAGGPQNVECHEQFPGQGSWDEENQCSLCKGGACYQFTLTPGPVTIVRFGRIDGRYVVHLTEGEAIPHKFDPTEVHGLTAVWPFAYVQLPPSADPLTFLGHMRSHHATIARGHIADAVRRFAAMCNIGVLEQR